MQSHCNNHENLPAGKKHKVIPSRRPGGWRQIAVVQRCAVLSPAAAGLASSALMASSSFGSEGVTPLA